MTHPATDSSEPDRVETVVEVSVPSGYRENERLDVYLTRTLPNVSRSKVQEGIRAGRVAVNEKVIRRPSEPVQADDQIVCRILKPPPIRADPEPIPLDIVFEDEHLIIVNKPAGMVVHPAYGNRTGTLVNALLHHVGSAGIAFEEEPEDEETDDVGLSTAAARPVAPGDVSIRPGIVHRLDKDTSGLLVVAKSDEVHRGLAAQFAAHTIERHYLALLRGELASQEGTVETAIGRDPRDRKRMAVSRRGGKRAVTHYRLLEPFDVASLVQFKLETGRTHQIRVHAAYLDAPVLGDATYGGDRVVGTSAQRARLGRLLKLIRRQALHAASLGFHHPVTAEELYFEAALPEDMSLALAHLRGGNTP